MPVDIEKLLHLESLATPGPYRLTDYKKLSACGKLVPYSLTDLELDVAMRNSIKELCTELKAAREVVEAAKIYLSWSKVDYPACTLDTSSEGVPCYCYDALDSKDSLINSIKNLDKARRG